MAIITVNIANKIPVVAYGSMIRADRYADYNYIPAFPNAKTIDLNGYLGTSVYSEGGARQNNTYTNGYKYVFSNHQNVTSITNFNQVVNASLDYCFNNCTNLVSVTNLPKYSNSMYYAFANTKLTEVPSLPKGIQYANYAFSNCTDLTNANLAGLTQVSGLFYTFNGCTSLTSAILPNNVKQLVGTFSGCTGLTSMPIIPSSVTNLSNTFSNCTGLTTASAFSNSLLILNSTFRNCTSLTTVTSIPDSVLEMPYAFSNCTNLSQAPILPNFVQNLASTFAGCTNLITPPTIPESVINLSRIFANCHNINSMELSLPTHENLEIFKIFNGVTDWYDKIKKIKNLNNLQSWQWLFGQNDDLIEFDITIPNSVKNLSYCFYYCRNLTTTPSIPENVTNMAYTFYMDNKLTTLPTIPNSVTNLSHAFYSCHNIEGTVNLPSNINDLSGTFAFIDHIIVPSIPNSVINMADTFKGCKNLVIPPAIPDCVNNLCNCFYGCYNLDVNGIRLPSSENLCCINMFYNVVKTTEDFEKLDLTAVKNIYAMFHNDQIINSANLCDSPSITNMAYTFYNCRQLFYVENLPTNVKDLSYCFSNTKLSSVPSLPTSVVNMCGTFSDTNIEYIPLKIPDSVKTLSYCFANCNKLMSTGTFGIGNSVTNIAYCFSGCKNTVNTPQNIPDSVINMAYCFEGCSNIRTTPNFGNSIQDLSYCFKECGWLNTIQPLPNSIINMAYAFSKCILLTTAPNIPKRVIDMTGCFQSTNLSGDINITSNIVAYATGCFLGNTNPINVYIPFRDVTGNYTKTYNSFTSAGYDTIGTKDGVYLKSLDNVTLTINPIPSDATVNFEYDGQVINNNTCIVPRGTTVTYTVSKQDYYSQTVTALVDKTTNVYVTLSVYPALTIKTDPIDAVITLTADGYTQIGNSIAAPAGTLITCVVADPLNRYESQTITYIMPENSITKEVYLQYEVNKIIFESNTPGTYTCTLRKGNSYKIDVVGAGAGGESMFVYSNYMTISGGSGAYTTITVPDNESLAGNYTLIIGEGSNGITIANEIYLGNSPADGGTSSVISPNGIMLTEAKGGYYTPDPYKALGPKGGNFINTTNTDYIFTGVKGNNGNNGGSLVTGNNQSPYGMEYGYGGGVTGWNAPVKGGNGYIKITVTGIRITDTYITGYRDNNTAEYMYRGINNKLYVME